MGSTGLCLNGVQPFDDACLCLVFCLAFESEHVRTPRSDLSVFGPGPFYVLFGVRPDLFAFWSVSGWPPVVCKSQSGLKRSPKFGCLGVDICGLGVHARVYVFGHYCVSVRAGVR